MRKAWLVVILIAITAGLCHADIIILRNGNRLEGEIVNEEENSVSIRMNNAVLNISRENISRIVRQESPRQLYQRMLNELGDDDHEGYYQVAQYCQMVNMQNEAIELLRHALLLKPDYAEALTKLRRIVNPPAEALLREARRFEAAGNEKLATLRYSRIAELYPESDHVVPAAAALAKIYYAQQKYAASMEQWKNVIERDPANTQAYFGVVKICEIIGEFDRAAELLRNVLKYERDEKLRNEAERQLRLLSGISETRAKISEQPGQPEHYETLATLFNELGHDQAAIRWMVLAVTRGSKNITIIEKLARFFEENHRPVKALEYWNRIVQMEPSGRLAAEAGNRIARLGILALVPEYMDSQDARRRREIVKILGDSGIPFDTIRSVVRQWLEYPEPESSGMMTHRLTVGERTQTYVIYVPEDYHPHTRWPLILALHPAGGSGDNYIFTWIQHAQRHGYFVLAPTADRADWIEAGGRFAIAALEDVCSRYNIDRNRVVIDGTSMGAYGAWSIAVAHPHKFAALISRSGAVEPITSTRLDNLFQTSAYIIHGLQDKIVPLEAMNRTHQALERLEYDVTLRVETRTGHSGFAGETDRIMTWLAGRERRPYPREVSFLLYEMDQPRSYWLQAELFADGIFNPDEDVAVPRIGEERLAGEMLFNYFLGTARQSMALLRGKVEGNTIRVDTRQIIGYTVLLDDELVDLDEPVTIFTNGRQSFSGVVRRSLPFMLEWARRHRDPEMLFSAHVRVVVRP